MILGVNGRFYAAPVTGVQRFAREVAGRLLRSHATVLFLPADAPPPAGLAPETRVVLGRLRGHVWEQLELPSQARALGCSVLLHLAGTAPLARTGDVLVIHDVLPLTDPAWFGRRFRAWRRLVLRRAAPRAGRIVTVSAWAADEIARSLRVAPRRITVAPQGLAPFDHPAPAAAVAAARARLGLDGPFLLAIGAADPRKNLRFLARVLLRWRERGADPPPLVVAGGAPARLFAAAGDWAAGLDVRTLGRLDDATLHALYTAAAALCHPAHAEGFGRPPLEALACGTPAVVADYACAREVLGGAACILPLEPDRWVDALAPLAATARADRATPGAPAAPPACPLPPAARASWDAAAAAVLDACRAAAAERLGNGRP